MRIVPPWLTALALTRSTASVVAFLTIPVPTPAQADPRAKELERALLVETGLSRPVAIRGDPTPGMRLVDRMTSYSVPGLSIAVIENGEVLWTKGHGLIEAGTESRVTAGTLFQTASIGKSIAAFVTLRLVDQDVLGLEDRINDRLKSWKVPENDFTRQRPVTLRQVLCHGAGFNVGGVDCYWPGEPLPTLLEVLTGTGAGVREAVTVQAVPGTAWRYSGGGYTVLEQLLSDVTGRSFAVLAQELVLAPLEMRNTFYEQPLTADHERAAAVGHRNDGRPYPGKWRVFPTLCPGGAWSTAEDTARFACEILAALEGRSALLSQPLAREMSKPQIASWGLGLQLQGVGRSSCFLHSGHNDGYTCIMVAF